MQTENMYTEFMSIVCNRFSCRRYAGVPMTEEQIKSVLEAARLAPSACNLQPWLFYVANTPELSAEIAATYDRPWIQSAATFIIVCGDHTKSWHRGDGKDHCDVDISIAVEHICLAAATMNLGTCWVCNFDKAKLCEALNLPEHIEPIAIIPIGEMAEGTYIPEKKRKELDEMVVWGKHQQ